MINFFPTKKKYFSLILILLFLFSPILYLKSTSDSYIFIKFLFICLNIIILFLLNNQNSRTLFCSFLSIPIFALIISILISVLNVQKFYDYIMALITLFLFLVLYFFISKENPLRSIYKMVAALCISSFIVSLYGIFQFINPGKIGPFDFEPARDYYNLVMHPSTFGHDNFAGEFIATSIPFILAFAIILFMKSRFILASFGVINLAGAIFYLLITQARGSWLGAIASLSIMLPFFVIKLNWKLKLKSLLIFSLILVIFSFSMVKLLNEEFDSITSKFLSTFNLEDNPIKFRLHLWNSTLKMVKNFFPAGTGLGNFKHYYPLYRSSEEIGISGPNIMVRKTHNEFLQVAVEAGPIGLFAFIWLISVTYKSIFILMRSEYIKNSASRYIILLASLGSITANIVQSLFGFSLQNPCSLLNFILSLGIVSYFFKMGRV